MTDAIRVLLIEDCAAHAELVQSQLGSSGFEVTHAWCWADAYKLLKTGQQFEDAILDLNLPDVSTPREREVVLDILSRFGLQTTILSGQARDWKLNAMLQQKRIPFVAKRELSDDQALLKVLLSQQQEKSGRTAQFSSELREIAIKSVNLEYRAKQTEDDIEKLQLVIDGGTGGYGLKSRVERVEARQDHLYNLADDNRRNDEAFRQEIRAEFAALKQEQRAELTALKEQRNQFRLENHKARWTIASVVIPVLLSAAIPHLPGAIAHLFAAHKPAIVVPVAN